MNMSEYKDFSLESFLQEFDTRCEGRFEIYKKDISNEKESRFISFQMTINLEKKVTDSRIERYTLFYSAYLSLLLKYTQNEILTGISFMIDTDERLIDMTTVPEFDKHLSIQDIQAVCKNELKKHSISEKMLMEIKSKIVDLGNCIFIYSNSESSFIQDRIHTDICLELVDDGEKLCQTIIFNEAVFTQEFISRFAQHYENILKCAIENPELPICEIDYLSKEELELLTGTWNRTEQEFPSDSCLHQLFECKVEEDPQAVAVYYEGMTMTRLTLNQRANQLAHYLRMNGAKTGDVIALYTNKSIGFVIGIMGILKAGCAYLPIDSSYPSARVEYIVKNSQVSTVVMTMEKVEKEEIFEGLNVIRLTKEGNELKEYSEENLNLAIDSKNPCYVIYTSGSTGQPKGVLLNHQGRVNNFHDFNTRFSIGDKDKVLAISSVSFDMSAYDILGSMMAGSSIVLPDPLLEKQPFHWLELIKKYQVTIWHSVPVLLDVLLKCSQHRNTNNIETIRVVLLGGDWIPVSLPDRFRKLNDKAVIISLGGATEVSMDSTIYYINEVDANWKSIPYGKPMANQKAYILDRFRELLPIGIPGELYLGGVGVGEGYYLNPQATQERFFDNPWMTEEEQRIYKTGDLAYLRDDGELILLGRMDFQVKINGSRIELGEIEHCLVGYQSVKRVVALVPKRLKKIVVYVECDPNQDMPTENELVEYLKERLPENYIPTYYVLSNEMPVTPNGKIDRKRITQLVDEYLHNMI